MTYPKRRKFVYSVPLRVVLEADNAREAMIALDAMRDAIGTQDKDIDKRVWMKAIVLDVPRVRKPLVKRAI